MSVSSFAGTPSADSKWAQLERQFPDSGGSDKSVSGRSGHKSVSGRSEDQFTASSFLEFLSWKMIVNPERAASCLYLSVINPESDGTQIPDSGMAVSTRENLIKSLSLQIPTPQFPPGLMETP